MQEKTQTLEEWKEKLKAQVLGGKKKRTKKAKTKSSPKLFTWRATTTCFLRVTQERAIRLAKAGEHVDPNPFCDYKKYGLEEMS